MLKFRNGLLLGCAIMVNGQGEVTGGGGPITAQAGEVTQSGGPAIVAAKDAVVDPAAPVVEVVETPEAKAAREAEETRVAALTSEQKAAEDAAKAEAAKAADPWESRDKTKDVALSTEESAEITGRTDLNDAQKAVMTDATLEMKTTGDLSQASISKASKAWGVPEDMVKQYVESLKPAYQAAKVAREAGITKEAGEAVKQPSFTQEEVTARATEIHKVTGTQENYNAFTTWANDNLTDSEKTDLVASINASPLAAGRAVANYYSRFQGQGGAAGGPKDVTRGSGNASPPPPAVQGFTSREEQNAALRKTNANGRPLMEVDPNYRQQVEAKMAMANFASNVTGSIMGAFKS